MSEEPSTSTTDASSFEGMYIRLLKPTGAFLEELRAAGFDPAKMEPRYPTELWQRCLEIARRHTFPELREDEGMRRLGRRFMEGYFRTLIGTVIGAAMPLMGLERTVSRVPRAWKASRPTIQIEVEKERPGQWRVFLRDPGVELSPAFFAGLLEGGALRTGEEIRVDVVERGADHCVLRARVTEGSA